MFAAVGAPVERLVRVRIGHAPARRPPSGRGPPAHGRRGAARSGPAAWRRTGDRRRGRPDPARRRLAARWSSPSTVPASTRQEQRRRGGRARARLPVLRHGPALSGPDLARPAATASTWATIRRRCCRSSPRSSSRRTSEGRLARVLVDGVDVTGRGPPAGGRPARVSEVSRVPEVRAALLARQRALAPAPARSSWPAATSAPSSCPTPTSSCSSTSRPRSAPAAGPRSVASPRTRPRRQAILAELRRRDELDRNRPGGAAPARAGRRPHRDRRQHVRGDGRRGGGRDPGRARPAPRASRPARHDARRRPARRPPARR